jgi:hypothetical protein
LQHLKLQPAMSADASRAVAVHTLLQERKSSLHTRMLWLPAPHADWLGFSDWAGGMGFVVCACAPAASRNMSPRAKITHLVMSMSGPRPSRRAGRE